MLTSTTVPAQIATARDDRLRVLVVGAGVLVVPATDVQGESDRMWWNKIE